MIGGLVEIAEDGRQLSVFRGFLIVAQDGQELGRVPLDDITALILSARQISLSRTVLDRLAERKAVIVTCGANFHPVSLTHPVDGHSDSADILQQQIATSQALKKRLWQAVVRAKVRNQSEALDSAHPHHEKVKEIFHLVRQVKSGDPDNREAVAARHYWKALMGTDFSRDRAASGPNAQLNYGYAILRAATARAVCAAGLHPALGIHHHSKRNSFALVDDLMEPFRPLVDLKVLEAIRAETTDVSPDFKRNMATILQLDMMSERGASPLINCLQTTALSLVKSLRTGKARLEIPDIKSIGQLL